MLEGKSIIITGAGSGIGRGAAQIFANGGARLLIADWKAATLKKARTDFFNILLGHAEEAR